MIFEGREAIKFLKKMKQNDKAMPSKTDKKLIKIMKELRGRGTK